MPIRPEHIIFTLSVLLIVWGVWMAARAAAGRRVQTKRPTCQACQRRVRMGDARCSACGTERATLRPTRQRAAIAFGFGGTAVMLGAIGLAIASKVGRAFASGENPQFEVSWILPTGLAVSIVGLFVLGMGVCRRKPRLVSGRPVRRRRAWGVAVVGLGVTAAGQFGWVDERVRVGGWVAAVPTDVLIHFMGDVPREWVMLDRVQARSRKIDLSLVGRIESGALTPAQVQQAVRRGIRELESTRRDGQWASAPSIVVLAALGSERSESHRDLDPSRVALVPGPTAPELTSLIPMLVDEGSHLDSDSFEIAEACRVMVYSAWRHDDNEDSRAAVRAALDPHIPALLETLATRSQARKDFVLQTLVMAEARPDVLDAIVANFESKYRSENAFTARTLDDTEGPRALVEMSLHQPAACDRLVAILIDGSSPRLSSLASIIRVWRPTDPRIGAALLGLLNSDDHARYTAAAVALPAFTEANSWAIERYLALLETDPNSGSRLGRSLGQTREHLLPHIDTLMELTEARWPGTRQGAWRAIECLVVTGDHRPRPVAEAEIERLDAAAHGALITEEDEAVLESIEDVLSWIRMARESMANDQSTQAATP